MNTESDVMSGWIPRSGFQLRKAGVQFDAVRVDGDRGREVADLLASMTDGDPGPVVQQANGARPVYFLVPVGSTAFKYWPPGVTPLAAGPNLVAYVPVPARGGATWPLSWRHEPYDEAHLVHAQLLCAALQSMPG
ncbi:hypothetical protein [Streptomyces beihaiensis]|uniref:DNA primase/polymerase bifunctional N-terminal domain-containing protein n=1 Tax=Streptomyces beihaiensis TaxID=2984495 RepID=A0ABT3TUR5_9ACTN|nr:hypothetical protein [Streptomyces beihaiensis]MCX3060770.1 hypothetical protein [Streptomyces beihaiensis]